MITFFLLIGFLPTLTLYLVFLFEDFFREPDHKFGKSCVYGVVPWGMALAMLIFLTFISEGLACLGFAIYRVLCG
jgi:hypothetical protein